MPLIANACYLPISIHSMVQPTTTASLSEANMPLVSVSIPQEINQDMISHQNPVGSW